MAQFGGIIVPIVTLFHEDGSVDWDGNHALVERLIHVGVDAIFFLGTTGEAAHFTPAERAELLLWGGKTFRERIPLLAGVGDPSTATSCELAKVATTAGFDGVVAIGPYFWTPGERHLYAHFRAIAEATPLPVFLYNYPQFVGVNLSVELVTRLAQEVPNIAGIKETLDSGSHMRRMAQTLKSLRPDFAVFCGHDDLGLFALTAGLDGMVSSTANFAPEIFVAMIRSFREGRFDDAMRLSAQIGKLVTLYLNDPCGAAIVKTALALRGWIESPYVRPPALPLEDAAVRQIRDVMASVGLSNE